jgi:all-trans-retinol dehydrogenase (NAD+)
MINLEAYENEVYQKATPIKYSFSNRMDIFLKTIIILVKVFTSLFFELGEKFLKLFTKVEKKSIVNQVALVTGGANGLGREIACKLAEEKCNVVIADININEAMKTAEFIEKNFKVKTKAYKVDVSNFEEIQKLKINIESDLAPVDILVNNAGIMPITSLREGKPKDIQKIIDVNLASHFWVINFFYSSTNLPK